MNTSIDCASLRQWFLEEQRLLPWRLDRTPYAVWVSEIMLQQTQVAVVIPYFERWMQRFPTVRHLAEASIDEVIKIWEGLGYYSRARYLHAGARYVLERHNGVIPDSEEELKMIKGLGPYTIGAIRSFAFHQRSAAVDGNVLRVLTRYLMIEEDISQPKTVNAIRELALTLLPQEESWVITEALIELGATVCTRKPKCGDCPLRKSCQSYIRGDAARLPYKSKKTSIEVLHRAVAVVRWQDKLLVRRGQQGEIMSDLYEFPYFESQASGADSAEMAANIRKRFDFETLYDKKLERVAHSFTRYRVHLEPIQFICRSRTRPQLIPHHQWLSPAELQRVAFSSGHRRIFQGLDENFEAS